MATTMSAVMTTWDKKDEKEDEKEDDDQITNVDDDNDDEKDQIDDGETEANLETITGRSATYLFYAGPRVERSQSCMLCSTVVINNENLSSRRSYETKVVSEWKGLSGLLSHHTETVNQFDKFVPTRLV